MERISLVAIFKVFFYKNLFPAVDCGLCLLLMFSCFSAAAAAGVVPLHCTSPDNNRPFQALFPLSDFILNPCPQFIKTKTRKRHSKMRWPKLQTQNLSQTDIPKDGKGDIMPQYCNRSNSFLFQSMAYVEVFPVDSCVQLTRPKTYLIISRWGGCGNLNQNLSIDVTLETSLSFWRANLNNDKKPISISI